MKITPDGVNTHYIGKIFERRIDGANSTIFTDVVYVFAGSKMVAQIVDKPAMAEETSYMHADHLGSVNLITNDQGGIVERLRFDVFGAPVDPKTGAALTGATADAKFGTTTTTRGYTGHEMDASTGLINMNARLYDPVLGRFISADTVVPSPGNMQDFNRYSYVNNNPLMYTDPSGHFIMAIAAAVMVAGAGAIASVPVWFVMAYAGIVSYAMSGGDLMAGVTGALSEALLLELVVM